MMFGFFWGDWTILIVLPAFIFALWTNFKVKSTFKKYSEIHTRSRITGELAARKVLEENGVYDVRIEQVHGHLTDHFDPRDNVIRLSEAVFTSTSAAAIGVAAHEAGHAVQYAKNYAPMKVRGAIVPATKFSSIFSMIIFFIGLIFAFGPFLLAGILLFSITTFFQLVTLPVEFNASARAMKSLKNSGRFTEEEIEGAGKVLSAAAMTYIAALAVSLLTLLRLIILAFGGGRRN